MVETTRRALSSPDDAPVDDGRGGTATANELARELRLLPDNVREVAGRLQAAGLLRQAESGVYRLACDPDGRACATSSARSSAVPADKPSVRAAAAGTELA